MEAVKGPTGLRQLLIGLGAYIQGTEVVTFGDAFEEYKTLQSKNSALLIPLISSAPLAIRGADRIDFVNGQVSNVVKELNIGGVNQSLLLDHRGHVQAEMSVLKHETDIFIAVENPGGVLVELGFNNHIVFDQVTVHNLESKMCTFSLQGKGATIILEGMGALPNQGYSYEGCIDGIEVLIYERARTASRGFDVHCKISDCEALLSGKFMEHVSLGGVDAIQIARVEAGIPSVATEARNGALPQEIELTKAVSFNKGCYLGQEIMARVDARARVNRGLAGVILEKPPCSGEYRVENQGRSVGWLGHVVEHPIIGLIGLAVLRHDFPSGSEGNVGDSRVRRVEIPFEISTRQKRF